MKELVIEFFGRVQGVNFRHSITNTAKTLGLKGFVKNNTDGSVYCLVQGEESSLEEFLQLTQKYSFPVKLTGMKFEWKDELSKHYKDFKVEFTNSFLADEAAALLTLGKRIFNKDELNIPKHVVIIPDGNRRWARSQGWLAYVGHRRAASMDRIVKMFFDCKEWGVEYLSIWGFSTENWDREQKEVDEIFGILSQSMPKLKELMHKEQIRFRHLGRRDRIPSDLMKQMLELEEETKVYSKLNFQLCLDYGGRASLVEAVNKLIESGVNEVTESDFAHSLNSNGIPDPDLIIRTSGEKRTSGIMPFEAVYAELYFTNVLFPDFDSLEFERAILDYSARTRRFGGTNAKDLKNVNGNLLIDPDLK